ncbi:MAG: FAD-dependent oxidoreductase [Actinomycetota bacterium]|nr:FAD-dependent oxidoreductase [Actinomycetota bacterium]
MKEVPHPMERDLIVIGGGAGGMAAARAAVRAGSRPVMVQLGPIGGDCTFTGCVPSKAVIEAAARGATFSEAMTSARRAVETIAATEADDVFHREGIDVIHARATFRSPRALDVDGSVLTSPRIVVATGATPAIPPIEGLTDLDYLTNENVFELDEQPSSLAVLGGGAVGCELAQAFRRLGSAVTLVEGLDRLLPKEEPEASEVIAEVFAAEGIDVRVGRKVMRIDALERKGAARLHIEGGEAMVAERVLVAVGRRSDTEGLGLEMAGVDTESGFVKVDRHLATTAEGIWAVGDVTGGLQFTHAADEMGRIAAANALSSRRPRRSFDPSAIPWVTFTSPEVARVGMTEAEAASHGGRVAFLPMSAVDRAIAAEETRGFVKLIAGPRPWLRNTGGGRILGATVVASRGGEMIHEPALAMTTRMLTGRLAQAVHAYPTWSIGLRQAAAQFFMEIDGRSARPARKATAG